MRILFLGETYRADAISWIKGVEMNLGVKLETRELPKGNSRILRMISALGFFVNLLMTRFSKQYDLVLAERATSYGFFSLFVHTKKRVIAQQGITDVYPEGGISGYYKSILQRLAYKNADLIHAWGHVMTYAMLESGASPHKIMVLPKGIDLGKYHCPEKRELAPAFIVTRSLYDLYRHIDIIEAVKILKDRSINIQVYIVGDGPEKPEIQSLINKYDLEEVVFLKGHIPNTQLPGLMDLCRYYVAVPTTEGVSSSLFEAMASGCYPIVTDLPANQAFIKNKINGQLVSPCKPSELADAIESALINGNQVDTALTENRKYIEDHVDHQKNMKIITDRYKTLMQIN
ncbi:glycosyltransferase involved in cell wall biosynthesis [Algoriphagus iocasae]|uniref:Glycosyltransferase involved in cell wall biosynthesis n=1 Tax=Algoriphagus iocasae TaxID=1836499 RepID=A0A841MQG4_9BACT|nr:glycosyltransferase family 4 protein [Algoriphagus iocasae]MBB6327767.1 glycosyltransferase involved in cell wall biosynthesis [Algoriphagus iocasae]